MITIDFVLITIMFIVFYLYFRNTYTYNRQIEANHLVAIYCCQLIALGKYDMEYDYSGNMRISYNAYLFNPFLWGKNSAIKKEFRHLFQETK